MLRNMNIVITGCSRGIGLELVKQLAEDHKVYCLTRNIEPLIELNNENVRVLSCDLSNINKSELDELFEDVDSIHVLINNAGILYNRPFSEILAEELMHSYQVNVMGPYLLTQYLLSRIIQGNGHVVNISSMGGVQGSVKFPGLSAYSSSKGALTILTECLAEEYKEESISFNCLALGAVQTEMLEEAFPGYQAPILPEEMANYILNFSLEGHKFQNGKVVQVSNSTP